MQQRQVPWRFLASGGASDSVFDSRMDTPVWHQRPFTPPICSEPPVDTSTRICWSRQRCRQFQLRWLMRRPVSKSHSLFTLLTCHLLLKEFDVQVAKMHLSTLGAELVALIVDVSPAGTSPKADCGASCERFCGDAKSVAFVSGNTGNRGGPTGPVHRQNHRCDSVLQHQVRPFQTVYIQTAQQTVEVVSASEFNVPEGQSRSTMCSSLTELLRYLL